MPSVKLLVELGASELQLPRVVDHYEVALVACVWRIRGLVFADQKLGALSRTVSDWRKRGCGDLLARRGVQRLGHWRRSNASVAASFAARLKPCRG